MKIDKPKPKITVWVKAVHRGLTALNTVDCIVRSARWEDDPSPPLGGGVSNLWV
mgnify:CR=1 FL=1|jgi:hypothetical protein